jgi:hypothetical protein
MSERALKWLAADVDVAGNASVQTETATVAVQANEVEVETANNAYVDLSTARVVVEAHNDADTISPDVTVLVGTAAVVVTANGIATDVALETATVSLQIIEPDFEIEPVDWSETMVLTLPRQIITLTLEDN